MKKKRFNEIQILTVLKEYEMDISAADLSRKYGKMEVIELKRLRQLERENHRLNLARADSKN